MISIENDYDTSLELGSLYWVRLKCLFKSLRSLAVKMNLKNLAVVRKRAVRNSFSPAFARVCSLVTIHRFVRKKNVRSQHATVLVILQRKNIKISKISMCLTCWQLVLEVVLEQSATIPVVRRLGQGAIVLPTDWISVLRKGRKRKQFRVTPGNTRDPYYLSGSQEWRTMFLWLFVSANAIQKCDHSNENYYVEKYFPVVLWLWSLWMKVQCHH